jgi:hypothetical protein
MKKWTNEGQSTSGQNTHEESLAIKEMQIKTKLRCHLTPVRMATIKNTNNNKYLPRCGRKGTSYTVGGNVN